MPKNTNITEQVLQLYDNLISTIAGIERKGASMPYTSFNGHMFSFIDKDGRLCLRLAEKERAEFIKKYETTLSEAHGTVLKEYVWVPENLLKNTSVLQSYFASSLNYIKTLKPKPKKNNNFI